MRAFCILLCFSMLHPCLAAQGPVNTGQEIATPQIGMPNLPPTLQTSGQPVIGFTLPTMPDDEFKFLVDPSVAKDLELVPDQLKQISDTQVQFGGKFDALVQKLMAEGSNPKQLKQLKEQIVNFHDERTKAIATILLPHQLTRIKQINQQMAIQYGGGISGAFQNPTMAKKLSLRGSQIDRLKEIQKEMKKEIAEKIQQCKDSAREEALKILDSEQKETLQKLTGDRFVRKADDWNERNGNVEKQR